MSKANAKLQQACYTVLHIRYYDIAAKYLFFVLKMTKHENHKMLGLKVNTTQWCNAEDFSIQKSKSECY